MEVRTEENFNNCLFLRSLNVLAWSINTLWTESLNRRPRSCSSTTPCLRRSLETAGGSRTSLSAREGSSTRRKWRYAMELSLGKSEACTATQLSCLSRQIHTTMMLGSTTFVWWRTTPTLTRSETFMSEPSPTSHPFRRRDIGDDTSTCGSTMLCMKSWKSRSHLELTSL